MYQNKFHNYLLLKKKSLAIFFLLVLSLSTNAQITFYRTFGWNSINEGRDIDFGIDGGYIIAGNTSVNNSDVYVIKLNDDGSIQWQQIYGGLNIDHGNSITRTADSCYIIAGYSNSFSASTDYDLYVIKIDRNGQLIWQKTYGGADWDFGYSIIRTTDDGFVIAGNSFSGSSGSSDAIFVKIDSAGNFVWQKIINSVGEDFIYGVCMTDNGEFIGNGVTENGFNGSKDIFCTRISSNGDSIWTKQYGSENDEESFAILNKHGYYSIVGSNLDTQKLNNLTMRIDEAGDSVNTYLLSHPEDEVTSALDTFGVNLWVTGFTNSFGGGKKDLFISKLDSNGSDLGGHTYGGSEDEFGNAILATPDSGAIAVGYTTTYGPGSQSVYVVKIDSLFATSSLVIGIEEFKSKIYTHNIFYNSSNKSINVSGDFFTNQKDLKFEIYSVQGNLIPFSIENNNNSFVLYPLNTLPGIYVFKMYDGDKIYPLKFFIH